MLKKVKISFVVLLVLLAFSSCSVLNMVMGGSGEAVGAAKVGDGEIVAPSAEDVLTMTYFDSIQVTADAVDDIFVTTEYMVTFDTNMFELLTPANAQKTEEALSDFKIANEGTMQTVVIDDPIALFVPTGNASGVTSITVEPLSNIARIASPFVFNVNITEPQLTVMAEDATTRLYGLTLNSTFEDSYYDGIKTRGIFPRSISQATLEYSSMNAVSHEYVLSVYVTGGYEDYVDVYFRGDNKPSSVEFSSSRSSISYSFYISASFDMMNYEGYKNGEDIELMVMVEDKTDGVYYAGTLFVPVESFDNSMSSFTNVYIATNGNVNAPAMVGTKVQIDADMEAFSTFDRFATVRVAVYDPSWNRVYTQTTNPKRNSEATVGTVAGGWGETEPFSRSVFSFIPKEVGEYHVRLYGYDNDGYNLCYYQGAFNVVQ